MNVAAVPPANADTLRVPDSNDAPVPGFDTLLEGAKAKRSAGPPAERATANDSSTDPGNEPETEGIIEVPASEPPAPEEAPPPDSTADALLIAAATVFVPDVPAAPLADAVDAATVTIDAAEAGTVIELAGDRTDTGTGAAPLIVAPAAPAAPAAPEAPAPPPAPELPVAETSPALPDAALPPPPADALPTPAPPAETPAPPAAELPDGPPTVAAPPPAPGDDAPAPVTQVTAPEEVPAAVGTVAPLPTVDVRDAENGADPVSASTDTRPAAAQPAQPAQSQAPAPALAEVRDARAPTAAPQPAPAEQLVSVLRPLRQGPDGAYRLSLEMRPPELGRVELRVELRDGVLHATMRAEHESTQQALRDAMTQLRARLETDGIRAGRLSVDDATTNMQGGQRQAANGRPDASLRRGRPLPVLPVTELVEPAQTADDGLDVRL